MFLSAVISARTVLYKYFEVKKSKLSIKLIQSYYTCDALQQKVP